ncbi:MAG TPA: glycoside hydrolase family 15 protein [Ktedonobacterales bacterium]
MPRDLPLSNGKLLADFDRAYNLRDVYWPHVGGRNHTDGHINHAGVWVDGQFSWFDDDAWRRELGYERDTLETRVTLEHDGLGLTIVCHDAVDFDRDVLIRRAAVTNRADHPREVRLFYHHDWHVTETAGANTVCYRPQSRAIVAYKDECYLLVNGQVGGQDTGIAYWATGYKEVNGQQGTWLDAVDGELGGNAIAQGSVDSCVGFHLGQVAAGATQLCYHWLAAGATFAEVEDLNRLVVTRGPQALLDRTHDYWHLWVNKEPQDHGDLPDELVDLYKRSLLILRTQIDRDGAIIASTDDDIWTWAQDSYNYMWPRDGALVASALSHSGYSEITRQFFQFCADAMSDDGYLLHKFTPTGALGSSWQPWVDAQGNAELPIQEDETALVVYSLWQHYTHFRDVEFIRPLYRPLVKAAADFMASYREPHTALPQSSWDLWEERQGIHAYTVAAVYAGLTAAAQFAALFGEEVLVERYRVAAEEIKAAARKHLWNDAAGRFVRRVTVRPDGTVDQDMTLDAAITGLYQFGMFPAESDEIRRTMDAIQAELSVKTAVGGFARYQADQYRKISDDVANVPGNPWFICSCWVAEYHMARAQTLDELHDALPLLEWVRARALPSGVLAEQVDPYTNAPASVSPLTWSHSEFVSAVRWYLGKHRRFEIEAIQVKADASPAAAARMLDHRAAHP